MLALVQWWQAGVSPWGGPERLPLQQNVYGPLYEWLALRCDLGPARPYLGGRLLSVLAGAAIAAGAGVWTWRRTRSPWIAWCVAVLPLTAKPVLDFVALYRVDALGVLLSLAAFAALVFAGSTFGVAVGVTLAGLAFLTKASLVAAPAAAVLALWRRQPRRALAVAAAVAVVYAAALALMQGATGGAYVPGLSWGMAIAAPNRPVEFAMRPALSGLWIAAIWVLARSRRGALAASPWTWYCAAAYAVAVFLAAQPMLSWNYLLELYPPLALLTGDLLAGATTLDRGAVAPAPAVRRATVLLALHGALSLPVVAYTIHQRLERVERHGAAVEASSRRLEPLIDAGRRVAVVDHDPGRDALNLLGAPSWVNLPWRLSERADVRWFIESALARGELDVVLWADDFAGAEGAP
jgi:hypothetical protein